MASFLPLSPQIPIYSPQTILRRDFEMAFRLQQDLVMEREFEEANAKIQMEKDAELARKVQAELEGEAERYQQERMAQEEKDASVAKKMAQSK